MFWNSLIYERVENPSYQTGARAGEDDAAECEDRSDRHNA